MKLNNKENLEDIQRDIYRDAFNKRKESDNAYPGQQDLNSKRLSQPFANPKQLNIYSESNLQGAKVLSPKPEHSKPQSTPNEESNGRINTEFLAELDNSTQFSGISITNSAEKHLNLSRATISFRQSINVDNLINICSRKLEIDPTHKKALFIRSSSYMKKGLFVEAIKDCNNLLKLDPHNVGAYYTRGCAHEKMGEIDKGIQDFTVVLELDPNHVNAAFARGACQNRKGDFAKAIDDYNMALEKDMENGPRKLLQYRRSTGKLDRSDNGLLSAGGDIDGSKRKNPNFQSPNGGLNGALSNQNVKPFVPFSKEEDLLNPEGNNYFMQVVDNSQIMTNDFRGNNSTTRSFMKNNTTDDNVSISSDMSFQELTNTSLMKIKERKMSDFSDMSESVKRMPNFKDNKGKAEWYHSQGFDARKKGDFPQAIEFYTKALELDPNHFKALFNRGFAYDKIGEYDAAIEDYTQAIRLDPKNAYAYYNRGISLDRKNLYDDAIKNFTIAISLEPNKADFHHNRGFAYRKKKNFQQAIIDYSRAIELDQNHFKAYYNRAFCYDKIGKLPEAEKDYTVALGIQPKNINALHHLGSLMEKIGGERLPVALEHFNLVIALDPTYAPSFNGRGLVFDKLGKYDEAYKDFTKAMQIDPKNPVFIHNRACCLRNMGKLEESLEDFDQALMLDDKNPIIYSNIGKLENFDKAIENYTKELFFNKENQKTYNNRAYCYAKLGKFKEAVSDYTKALSLDPKNIHALHNRGICYERLGLFRNAIEDFTIVISLNKNNANAYFNRGCCYDSIGELDLAIADYSLALEIDSKNGHHNRDKFALSEC